MGVALLLALAWVVLLVGVAVGIGVLARRADRQDEHEALRRIRIRWAASRRGARRTRGASVVRLRLLHRPRSAVDQRQDSTPPRLPED